MHINAYLRDKAVKPLRYSRGAHEQQLRESLRGLFLK